jgi:hypothetical protein
VFSVPCRRAVCAVAAAFSCALGRACGTPSLHDVMITGNAESVHSLEVLEGAVVMRVKSSYELVPF